MDWDFTLDHLKGESNYERMIRLGKGLGYPDCCIQAFLTEDFRTRPIRKLEGTGYVPCAECNKKSPQELVSIINANRKCVERFPKSPWNQEWHLS